MKVRIVCPDNKIVFLKADKKTTVKERIKMINKLLKKYGKYIRKYKSSYKTKRFLNGCAQFLLKDTNKRKVLTNKKIKNIRKKEIPLSSIRNKFVEQLFYSDGRYSEDDNEMSDSKIINNTSFSESIEKLTNHQMKMQNIILKNQMKRYEETKTYRINQLYSTPVIKTYRIEPVEHQKVKVNGQEKVITKTKNFYGYPILDARYLIIGGKKGLIELNERYIAEWCLVDTENIFRFNNITFRIDDSVKQYKVGFDNKSEMDKILCYYSFDKDQYYFFDENINQIKNEYIHIVG